MKILRTKTFLFIFFLIGNCASPAKKWELSFSHTNFYPQEYDQKEIKSFPTAVVIPPYTVHMCKVSIIHSPLYIAPGTQYPIKDLILPQGTSLLVVGQYKNWIKVVNIESKISGWVHQRMVTHQYLNDEAIEIDPRKLPIKVVRQQIEEFYQSDDKKRKITIHKGSLLPVLSEEQDRSLVWLVGSHSLGWVDAKNLL